GGAARFGTDADHVRVAYAQGAASGHLGAGLGQSAAGEAGSLTWRRERHGRWGELDLARADDHHESAGDTLPWSRRDAGESRVEVRGGAAALGGQLGAGAAWSEARRRRSGTLGSDF